MNAHPHCSRRTQRRVLAAALTAVAWLSPVFAQTDLPARMQGKWTSARDPSKTGATTIESVQVESADKVRVKISMLDTAGPEGQRCKDFGVIETVAERSSGAWLIRVPHPVCASYFIKLTPVEGQHRFEGAFSSDIFGGGSIVYDW